jgi:GTP-binding protein EngB required for normal cell division
MSNAMNTLSKLIDEFMMLLAESADFQQQPEVKSVLREAQATVARKRKQLLLASKRYVVAVVGLTNVGKSTLLNALLGEELAPRRNRPCTAAPIEFVHGETLRVTAYHHQSVTRPTWTCAHVEAVHLRLEQLADDSGAEASSRIKKVVVQVPLPLLDNGLVFADTPGFGAAQAGDTTGSHEESLKRYLREDVSQVFWVVLAEQGIGKREKSFHDQFFADVCDDVIVTGCEDWDTQDRERFRRRFADSFGQRIPTFHFVSGKEGGDARKANDLAGLERSGITTLENRIRELVVPNGRTAALEDTLKQLAQDIDFWMTEFQDESGRPLARRWRPDSWSRWLAAQTDGELKKNITECLRDRDYA